MSAQTSETTTTAYTEDKRAVAVLRMNQIDALSSFEVVEEPERVAWIDIYFLNMHLQRYSHIIHVKGRATSLVTCQLTATESARFVNDKDLCVVRAAIDNWKAPITHFALINDFTRSDGMVEFETPLDDSFVFLAKRPWTQAFFKRFISLKDGSHQLAIGIVNLDRLREATEEVERVVGSGAFENTFPLSVTGKACNFVVTCADPSDKFLKIKLTWDQSLAAVVETVPDVEGNFIFEREDGEKFPEPIPLYPFSKSSSSFAGLNNRGNVTDDYETTDSYSVSTHTTELRHRKGKTTVAKITTSRADELVLCGVVTDLQLLESINEAFPCLRRYSEIIHVEGKLTSSARVELATSPESRTVEKEKLCMLRMIVENNKVVNYFMISDFMFDRNTGIASVETNEFCLWIFAQVPELEAICKRYRVGEDGSMMKMIVGIINCEKLDQAKQRLKSLIGVHSDVDIDFGDMVPISITQFSSSFLVKGMSRVGNVSTTITWMNNFTSLYATLPVSLNSSPVEQVCFIRDYDGVEFCLPAFELTSNVVIHQPRDGNLEALLERIDINTTATAQRF